MKSKKGESVSIHGEMPSLSLSNPYLAEQRETTRRVVQDADVNLRASTPVERSGMCNRLGDVQDSPGAQALPPRNSLQG